LKFVKAQIEELNSMSMPWQLRNAKRRRSRHSEPRPTIELMPAININELRHAIPRYSNDTYEPDVFGLKYPQIARLRLSTFRLEITDYSGRIQCFHIRWARTGFGRHRPILLCNSCGRGAIRLFVCYGTYACRHCHRALYASQKNNQIGRKRLQASKLRLQLGTLPDICEPMPSKPKWIRRRTYQRLRSQILALETKAKTRRFRKPLTTRLFAYHT
jgi:hypothetical protein